MTCRCRSGECDPDCDGPKLRAEIQQLKAQNNMIFTDAAGLTQVVDALAIENIELRAEIARLKANHLSALQLSDEWMAKHDRLLAFIQSRPEMLTELIAEEPKP